MKVKELIEVIKDYPNYNVKFVTCLSGFEEISVDYFDVNGSFIDHLKMQIHLEE